MPSLLYTHYGLSTGEKGIQRRLEIPQCLARLVDFLVIIMTHTTELVYYCGAVVLWSYFLSVVNAS